LEIQAKIAEKDAAQQELQDRADILELGATRCKKLIPMVEKLQAQLNAAIDGTDSEIKKLKRKRYRTNVKILFTNLISRMESGLVKDVRFVRGTNPKACWDVSDFVQNKKLWFGLQIFYVKPKKISIPDKDFYNWNPTELGLRPELIVKTSNKLKSVATNHIAMQRLGWIPNSRLVRRLAEAERRR